MVAIKESEPPSKVRRYQAGNAGLIHPGSAILHSERMMGSIGPAGIAVSVAGLFDDRIPRRAVALRALARSAYAAARAGRRRRHVLHLAGMQQTQDAQIG